MSDAKIEKEFCARPLKEKEIFAGFGRRQAASRWGGFLPVRAEILAQNGFALRSAIATKLDIESFRKKVRARFARALGVVVFYYFTPLMPFGLFSAAAQLFWSSLWAVIISAIGYTLLEQLNIYFLPIIIISLGLWIFTMFLPIKKTAL